MSGYFVLKRSGTQFMFNLHAGNHEVILTSEQYTTKASAEGGIAAVQKYSADEARYMRKTAKDGSHYFTLVAANGESVGRSEMYSTAQARDKGIESVRTNGPKSPTKDQT
jgi:uncharacterized protein YegP (UPF0339 family)